MWGGGEHYMQVLNLSIFYSPRARVQLKVLPLKSQRRQLHSLNENLELSRAF